MITEEHQKEGLSVKYMEAIAVAEGYKTVSSFPDYGTDFSIIKVGSRNENGKLRYVDSGNRVDVQIKATLESRVVSRTGGMIGYDLDVKNYNDLVYRLKTRSWLFLVLFILPEEKDEWLELTDNELIIRKCAYWYLPEHGLAPTTNKNTIRIFIPEENQITLGTIAKLLDMQL